MQSIKKTFILCLLPTTLFMVSSITKESPCGVCSRFTSSMPLCCEQRWSISSNKSSHHSYRLPGDILPIRYLVRLEPDFYRRVSEGFTSIQMKVIRPSRTITVNADNNSVMIDPSRVVVRYKNSFIKIAHQEADFKRQFYHIHLVENLWPFIVYEVDFYFSSRIFPNAKNNSFFISKDKAGNWVAATQLQPSVTRNVFPCFDEPAMKAKFNFELKVPPGFHALSNMNPITKRNGFVVFDETPPMSTYIVAIVITSAIPLTTFSRRGVTFNTYVPGNYKEHIQYMSQVSPVVLDVLEQYFAGIPFPLTKIDNVLLPDFLYVGMENWGLVTYNYNHLYLEGVTSFKNKYDILGNICHELTHQWFGNLVTMSWYNQLWLNEGFTTKIQYLVCNEVDPRMQFELLFYVTDFRASMEMDIAGTLEPVSVPADTINTLKEQMTMFGIQSYKKGACIVSMMRHFLKPANFLRGLMNYIREFQYSSTTQGKHLANCLIHLRHDYRHLNET